MGEEKILNPYYSETRASIRKIILLEIEEFVAELEAFKIDIAEDNIRYKVNSRTQVDKDLLMDFKARWKVKILLSDNGNYIDFKDSINLQHLTGELAELILKEQRYSGERNEYIAFPKSFSVKEARELLSQFLTRPKGYDNFKTYSELYDSIQFFKLIRYQHLNKTEAMRVLKPDYDYSTDHNYRKKMLTRYQSILDIVEFPENLIRE